MFWVDQLKCFLFFFFLLMVCFFVQELLEDILSVWFLMGYKTSILVVWNDLNLCVRAQSLHSQQKYIRAHCTSLFSKFDYSIQIVILVTVSDH